MEYGRGEERVWVDGALRVGDGRARTLTAPSRNTAGWQRLLQAVERANPTGDLYDLYVVSDNLSSHDRRALRAWLVDHPRIRQVFIPKGACWLNLQEGWWRLFRRAALAGQSFANARELERATRVATGQLNARAGPWVWVWVWVWVPVIRSPHATCAYSWISPPSRSRRTTLPAGMTAADSTDPSGGAWPKARCGRCTL